MSKFAADLVLADVTTQLLEAFVRDPSHGLLLTGEHGVGLYTIARALGESVYGAGIRLIVIPEDGKDITIDQIRALYSDTKSVHDKGLVVVIDDGDRMSHPAQNALLKLLEEPPQNTLFILTSHNQGSLLPTILSRLSTIEVRRVSKPVSDAFIAANVDDANKQIQISFLAQGRPAEIMRLANDGDLFDAQAVVIRDARSFIQSPVYGRLIIANSYTQRDKAFQLVAALSHVTVFTQRRGEQVSAIHYASVAEAIDNLHDNAHAKLQLMKLALTL